MFDTSRISDSLKKISTGLNCCKNTKFRDTEQTYNPGMLLTSSVHRTNFVYIFESSQF